MADPVVILGVFVADTAYRAERQPRMGETILGQSFALGPGGKGSNQAVASARAGADTRMLTKLGQDTFGDIALKIWAEAGVTPVITRHVDSYTGAAFIFLEAATGNNAIIICPGVAATISPADVDGWGETIAAARVFMTQLEQPIDAAHRALERARRASATTILNPAPAAELPEGILGLCDWVTPNESEAEGLTGVAVTGPDSAHAAAEALIARGAGAAIVTLGAYGVYLHDGRAGRHLQAISAGPVVETTGAGDAFNGGFAAALAGGADPLAAVRFGLATAGLSVTRAGTAPSMPLRAEIEALLAGS